MNAENKHPIYTKTKIKLRGDRSLSFEQLHVYPRNDLKVQLS